MSFNSYLGLFLSGTTAALPATPDLPSVPKFYYATDTNGVYVWNPTTAAWELQYQLKPVTFANLPTTGKLIGTEAIVSDATAPTKGGVITGGGAVLTGAVWDGAAWRAI